MFRNLPFLLIFTAQVLSISRLKADDVEKLRYLRKVAPAVVDLFSTKDLYQKYPKAKAGKHQHNDDGSLEIFWGDNLVQHHAMIDTKTDKVLAYRTRIFRGTLSAAETGAKEPKEALGNPKKVASPVTEPDVVEYRFWSSLGYGVRTAVIKGKTVDGKVVYFTELMTSNQLAIAKLLKR